MNQSNVYDLLKHSPSSLQLFHTRQSEITKQINGTLSLNDVLISDMNLVLVSDMLRKVDSMSMANSLEVRNPLLDYTVVNFAFSIPSAFKLNKKGQKQILKDTFKHLLPEELLNRRKQGFEVPLYRWFNKELKSLINDTYLNDEFILEQNLFSISEIKRLKSKLYSNNPGDSTAQIWALIVFQHWWKKYFRK
jgi:asparagine synthase (glutamine-hydrolysing)